MKIFQLIILLLIFILIPISTHASVIDDIKWLSLNIYHESRSEPINGQFLVALTTLNRVKDSKYPNSIKNVITEKSQFSWYWDGKSDQPRNTQSWMNSIYISSITMVLYKYIDFRNILWYHNHTVVPKWSRNLNKVIIVGNHSFYMEN